MTMSRAMNVNLTESQVRRVCEGMSIAITAIEPLIPSGTRVVCQNVEGSLALWNKLRANIIPGPVRRMPRSLRTAQ